MRKSWNYKTLEFYFLRKRKDNLARVARRRHHYSASPLPLSLAAIRAPCRKPVPEQRRWPQGTLAPPPPFSPCLPLKVAPHRPWRPRRLKLPDPESQGPDPASRGWIYAHMGAWATRNGCPRAPVRWCRGRHCRRWRRPVGCSLTSEAPHLLEVNACRACGDGGAASAFVLRPASASV